MSDNGDDLPESPGPDASVNEVLLAVQDFDTAISQLQHRKEMLDERAALTRAEQRLRELTAARRDANGRRQVIVDKLTDLENQVATLGARRSAIEERMYAARGAQARDLQAMDEEIHHLALRRSELEDEELELMEAQEPIDNELAQIQTEGVTLEKAAGQLRAAVAASDTSINSEITTLELSRGMAAQRLPDDLLARYEELRAKLKGTGAARLIGSRCEGCHLDLPSMEVDRIHKLSPDEVVTCDNCGRILIRAPKHSGA